MSDQYVHLLRPEARPMSFDQLTEDQKAGLKKLLLMIEAALDRLPSVRGSAGAQAGWVTDDRRSQLAFIHGKRGTGKSSLMLTLVNLLSRQRSRYESDPDATEPDWLRRARRLSQRVVLLEPLDMEPLPKDTPILAAILARLKAATEALMPARYRAHRHAADFDPRMECAEVTFDQFRQQVARGLDSNLSNRKGSLDREQYGQAVSEQEDDRLQLYPRLEQALRDLSRMLLPVEPSRCEDDDRRFESLLFLVPVDDVDLNPERCMELLRLLRVNSPPQLFFLLMGQFDLVQDIAKMHTVRDFQGLYGSVKELSAISSDSLKQTLAEVAMANVQKLIPQVIRLEPLNLREVLNFRPLLGAADGVSNASTDRTGANKRPESLGEIFQRISFPPDISKLPAQIRNLHDLLWPSSWQNDPNKKRLDCADYCGLEAFRISARRLVDLWGELRGVVPALTASQEEQKDAAKKIFEVFEHHWKRVLDEDVLLDANTRERLADDYGIDRLAVVGPRDQELTAKDDVDKAVAKGVSAGTRWTKRNGVMVHELAEKLDIVVKDKDGSDIKFSPVLRTTLYGDGTNAPYLRETVSGKLIEDLRVRATYVVLQDLRLGLGLAPQDRDLAEPRISFDPVAVEWQTANQPIGLIPWQMPPTRSFVAASRHLRIWTDATKSSLSQSEKGAKVIDSAALDVLLRTWLMLSSEIMETEIHSDQAQTGSKLEWAGSSAEFLKQVRWDWSEIANRLANCLAADLPPRVRDRRELVCRSIMNIMPETAVILNPFDSLAVDTVPRQTLAQFFQQRRAELLKRRASHFATWQIESVDGNRRLWNELNERAASGKLFPLGLPQPNVTDEQGLSEKIEKVEQSVVEARRDAKLDTQLAEARATVRQGQGLIASQSRLAVSMLRTVLIWGAPQNGSESQQREYEMIKAEAKATLGAALAKTKKTSESKKYWDESLADLHSLAERAQASPEIRSQLRRMHDWIGGFLADAGFRQEGIRHFQAKLDLVLADAQQNPEAESAQRELIEAHQALGDALREDGQFDLAIKSYLAALERVKALLAASPSDVELMRDLSITLERLGVAQKASGDREAAIASFTESRSNLQSILQQNKNDRDAKVRDCSALIWLASTYREVGRRDEERAFIEQCQFACEALLRENSRDNTANRYLRDCLRWKANYEEFHKRFSKAQALYVAMRSNAYAELEVDSGDESARSDVGLASLLLGDCLDKQQRLEQSLEDYEIALDTFERLNDFDEKREKWQRECGAVLGRLAAIRWKLGDREKAMEYGRRWRKITEEYASRMPNSREAQVEFAEALMWWADRDLEARRLEIARKKFEEAIAKLEPIVASDPGNGPWQLRLAVARYRLSACLKANDSKRGELQELAWKAILGERARGTYFWPEAVQIENELRRVVGGKTPRSGMTKQSGESEGKNRGKKPKTSLPKAEAKKAGSNRKTGAKKK